MIEHEKWCDQGCDCAANPVREKELLGRLDATSKKLAQYAQASMAPEYELQRRIHDLESKLETASKAIKERDAICADSLRAQADLVSRLDNANGELVKARLDQQTAEARLSSLLNAVREVVADLRYTEPEHDDLIHNNWHKLKHALLEASHDALAVEKPALKSDDFAASGGEWNE